MKYGLMHDKNVKSLKESSFFFFFLWKFKLRAYRKQKLTILSLVDVKH